MSRRQESPVTLQVHIGRLVLDQRVATGARGAIGESIQTELASLLSNGGRGDAHAQDVGRRSPAALRRASRAG